MLNEGRWNGVSLFGETGEVEQRVIEETKGMIC